MWTNLIKKLENDQALEASKMSEEEKLSVVRIEVTDTAKTKVGWLDERDPPKSVEDSAPFDFNMNGRDIRNGESLDKSIFVNTNVPISIPQCY